MQEHTGHNTGERIARLQVEMEQVQEGVSNFRAFQRENREFMGWFRSQQEERVKLDKKRSKVHFALLGLLIALIVALFSFLLQHFDNKHISALDVFSTRQDATASPTHY